MNIELNDLEKEYIIDSLYSKLHTLHDATRLTLIANHKEAYLDCIRDIEDILKKLGENP